MIDFFKDLHRGLVGFLSIFTDIPALIFRLTLAYGFFQPARTKWSDIEAVGKWFASMNYPFPVLNAYMAASTEALGVLLLTVGLATRLISLPLMVVMIVATLTVHWKAGFAACQCSAPGGPLFGFEIPFYYFIMLFFLFIKGPGRVSLDALVYRWASLRKSREKLKEPSGPYNRNW